MSPDEARRTELARSLSRSCDLPPHDRVLDGLADALWDIDKVLDLLSSDDAMPVWWAEDRVRGIYDAINELMMNMSN